MFTRLEAYKAEVVVFTTLRKSDDFQEPALCDSTQTTRPLGVGCLETNHIREGSIGAVFILERM